MASTNDLRKRSFKWCFTYNNYTEEGETKLKEFGKTDCKWMIFGHETAPTTGTPHLQGYLVLKERLRGSQLNKNFDGKIIWIFARGSNEENKKYCSKGENIIEIGKQPPENPGGEKNKTNWKLIRELAEQGRFNEIPDSIRFNHYKNIEYFWLKNRKAKDCIEWSDNDLKDHFLWLCGPTGTGKSHRARMIAERLDKEHPPYLKGLNKWWSGYDMQRVVIIDEADPKKCEHLGSFFKQWFDKWTFTAETKGGTIPSCRPEYIIVTSNYSIAECFPEENDYLPLKRRIYEHTIKTRTEPFTWPPEHTIQHTDSLNTTQQDKPQQEEKGQRIEGPSQNDVALENPCLKRPREEEMGHGHRFLGNIDCKKRCPTNETNTQDDTDNTQHNKDNDTQQTDEYPANPFNL